MVESHFRRSSRAPAPEGEADDKMESVANPKSPSGGDTPAGGESTILVVDDNPVVLTQTSHLLQQAGFRVVKAASGAEALDIARRDLPDLMLMDVRLGDANGIELCQRLKREERTKGIFVVLVSVSEISSDQQALGLTEGADGYIARPISGKELVARMAAMARIQRAEAGLKAAQLELEDRVQARTRDLNLALEEARRGRERLEQLSMKLVEVQEAERRYVAHELHDEIGQLLTGLKLSLNRSIDAAGGARADELREAVGIIDNLVSRVRELSLDLRPQMLDDLGLLPALQSLLNRFQTRSGLQISLECDGLTRRLESRTETTLYRVTQEALTNIGRHANASVIDVSLYAVDDQLELTISDDGDGFDVAAALESKRSNGLAGMRERTAMVDGIFSARSDAGAGTTLNITAPARYRDEHSNEEDS